MATNYTNYNRPTYGVFSEKDAKEIYHKDDPVAVFENAIDRENKDLANAILLASRDIYCLVNRMVGVIDDKTINEIKSHASQVAKVIAPYSSDRLPRIYWFPEDVHNG